MSLSIPDSVVVRRRFKCATVWWWWWWWWWGWWSCYYECALECWRLSLPQDQTRNSAVADKPRDAYVQKQWRDWPPKTRPSLYVLPCWICFTTSKDVDINTEEPQKLGSDGTPLSWDGRRGWHQNTRISPTCVTMSKYGSSATKGVHIKRKEPSKLRSTGTPPLLGWGVDDHLKTNLKLKTPSLYVLPRQIW